MNKVKKAQLEAKSQQELLKKLHAQDNKSAVVTQAVKQEVQLKDKSKTEQAKQSEKITVRASQRDAEAVELIDEDTKSFAYKSRVYMRRSTDDEKTCRHFTQYFNSESKQYELLTKQLAVKLCAKLMLQLKKESYKTSDFITSLKTCGSAYGDIIRSALDVLHKEKALVKQIDDTNAVRKTYIYTSIDTAQLEKFAK